MKVLGRRLDHRVALGVERDTVIGFQLRVCRAQRRGFSARARW